MTKNNKSASVTSTDSADKAAKAALAKTLKSILGKYVTAHAGTAKASVTAAMRATEYVNTGGTQADLVTATGGDKSTVSRYLLLGRALGLVSDGDADFTKRLVDTVYGRSNGGDRKALVSAVKEKDAASVVAAVMAAKDASKVIAVSGGGNESEGSGDKGNVHTTSKARQEKVADMSSEALVALLAETVAALADREDVTGALADRFAKVAKSASIFAAKRAALAVA